MLSKRAKQKRLEKKKKRRSQNKANGKSLQLHNNENSHAPSIMKITDDTCPECGDSHYMEYVYSVLLSSIAAPTDEVCPDCGSDYCEDYIDFKFEILECSDDTD